MAIKSINHEISKPDQTIKMVYSAKWLAPKPRGIWCGILVMLMWPAKRV